MPFGKLKFTFGDVHPPESKENWGYSCDVMWVAMATKLHTITNHVRRLYVSALCETGKTYIHHDNRHHYCHYHDNRVIP